MVAYRQWQTNFKQSIADIFDNEKLFSNEYFNLSINLFFDLYTQDRKIFLFYVALTPTYNQLVALKQWNNLYTCCPSYCFQWFNEPVLLCKQSFSQRMAKKSLLLHRIEVGHHYLCE